MSLSLSCFLSSIIRHLSTDGLEELVLTIANENSVTWNPIWPCNFSPIVPGTHRLSSPLLFFLAAAEKERVFRVAGTVWNLFCLMLSYYSMSEFPVLREACQQKWPHFSLSSSFPFSTNSSGGPAGKVAPPHVCWKRERLKSSAGPAFKCQ